MSDFKRLGQFGLMLAGAGIAILAYEAGRARAGVPTTQALVYSGFLTDDTGAPIKGQRSIAVDLYGSSDPSDDVPLCDAVSQNIDLTLTDGYFSLVLNDDCSVKVQEDKTEPWVEVRVDGNPMPRTRIAAVPYALQAASLTQAAVNNLRMEFKQEIKDALATTEVAYPECPPGYSRMNDNPVWAPQFVHCTKGNDEVMLVGSGSASFWIDRTEASIWTTPEGSPAGMWKFGENDDSSDDFPKNGQVKKGGELYAVSGPGAHPARYVTWFQAQQACAASEKRLPSVEEWLRAARGTLKPDEAGSDNTTHKCYIGGVSNIVRDTGKAIDPNGTDATTSCVSYWGGEDMIGNLEEMTSEWAISAGVLTAGSNGEKPGWESVPGGVYDFAHTFNVGSAVLGIPGSGVGDGLPAVVNLGSAAGLGQASGMLTLDLNSSPGYWDGRTGFRCMIPR